MKTDFSINVQVNIGITPEVVQLVTHILQRMQPVAENPQPEPRRETEPVAEPAPGPRTETAAPVGAEPGNKEYTEVDVRAAMDRARMRIEGENWKAKPDSEGYKKWHRVLNDWFRNTAAVFGADKPSTLEDSESRRKFIEACDRVVAENDELIEKTPF